MVEKTKEFLESENRWEDEPELSPIPAERAAKLSELYSRELRRRKFLWDSEKV